MPPAQKADMLRMLLLVVSIVILAPLTDASKIYHSIRGQDTIKLYVIFNALEVGMRLLSLHGSLPWTDSNLDCV
jgi:Eukaryotic membrane protein family